MRIEKQCNCKCTCASQSEKSNNKNNSYYYYKDKYPKYYYTYQDDPNVGVYSLGTGTIAIAQNSNTVTKPAVNTNKITFAISEEMKNDFATTLYDKMVTEWAIEKEKLLLKSLSKGYIPNGTA